MTHETQQQTASEAPTAKSKTRQTKLPPGLTRRGKSKQIYTKITTSPGKQSQRRTGTTNVELAKKILAKRLADVAEGRYLDVKEERLITVKEMCTQYWAARGPDLVKAKGNHALVKLWQNGKLSSALVKDLTPELVNTFLNERERVVKETPALPAGEGKLGDYYARGFSDSTRNRCLAKLKAMIRWSVKSNKLDGNPISDLKGRREGNGRTEYLEQAEITELMTRLETTKAKQWFKDFVTMAISTGCRRGEMLKMTWTDINFKSRMLTVQAENSKTGKSRTLPIDPVLYAVLETRFEKRVEGNPFVFSYEGEAQKGVHVTAVNKAWKKTVKGSTKLSRFTLYHLRHTTLSHWANNGIPLTVVQRMAGHSSPMTTARYLHPAADVNEKLTNITGQLLGSTTVKVLPNRPPADQGSSGGVKETTSKQDQVA